MCIRDSGTTAITPESTRTMSMTKNISGAISIADKIKRFISMQFI